jgi:hypothetical protein
MVINRRQAAEALVITAVRAAINPSMATERPAIPSLALRTKATVSARGSRTPNTTAKPRICERTVWADKDLHMHGLEEAGASQMRQPSRVIAVGLVGGK